MAVGVRHGQQDADLQGLPLRRRRRAGLHDDPGLDVLELPDDGLHRQRPRARREHTYTVRVTDPFGNLLDLGTTNSVTISAGSQSQYASDVVNDGATDFWRLGEPSGTAGYDHAGFNDATAPDGCDPRRRRRDLRRQRRRVRPSTAAPTASWPPTRPSRRRPTCHARGVGQDDDRPAAARSSATATRRPARAPTTTGTSTWTTPATSSSACTPTASARSRARRPTTTAQWHHVVGDARRDEGHGALHRRQEGRRDQRHHVGPALHRLLADRRRQHQRLAEPAERATTSPARSTTSRSTRPRWRWPQVQQHYTRQRPHARRPAGAGGRLRQGRLQRRPGPLLAARTRPSGTTANDAARTATTAPSPAASRSASRGGVRDGNTPSPFNGSDGADRLATSRLDPTVYSEELWFKTDHDPRRQADRLRQPADRQQRQLRPPRLHGELRPAALRRWTGQANTVTRRTAYNDSAWHHVVATQGPDGMTLYVDGSAGRHATRRPAQAYNGYWRVGGDTDWGGDSPTSTAPSTRSRSTPRSSPRPRSRALRRRRRRGGQPGAGRGFTRLRGRSAASFDGTGSPDPDGTIASYAWDFGDGTRARARSPTTPTARPATTPWR